MAAGTGNKSLDELVPKDGFPTTIVKRNAPRKQYATATSGAIANTLAPGVRFRLLSVDLKINTAGTTDEAFTITQDAIEGAAYDRLIVTQNTKTPAVTSLFLPFGEGYEYEAGDELDAAWPNTEGRTYGLVWTWEPLP